MAGGGEDDGSAAALAALTICESLLITIEEQAILSRAQIEGLLDDAISSRLQEAEAGHHPATQKAAADLIAKIRDHKNAMRGPNR